MENLFLKRRKEKVKLADNKNVVSILKEMSEYWKARAKDYIENEKEIRSLKK